MDLKLDTFANILLSDEKKMLKAFGYDRAKQAKRELGFKSKSEMLATMKMKVYIDIFNGVPLTKTLDRFYRCYV